MMHPLDKALRDVQYLSRIVESWAAPSVTESIRTVYKIASTKREDVAIWEPVATDAEFCIRFRDWAPEQLRSGPQRLTAEQIIDLRRFCIGRLCKLEHELNQQAVRQMAYRDQIVECDKALSFLMY